MFPACQLRTCSRRTLDEKALKAVPHTLLQLLIARESEVEATSLSVSKEQSLPQQLSDEIAWWLATLVLNRVVQGSTPTVPSGSI